MLRDYAIGAVPLEVVQFLVAHVARLWDLCVIVYNKNIARYKIDRVN